MKILTEDDLLNLHQIQNGSKAAENVPLGYLPIELSTKGKLGAPAIFHIRNFKTADLVDLSLTSEDDLTETVINMLKNMIWEKDVEIKNWHEKEISELLVRLYMVFFSSEMTEIDFIPSDEDLDFLKEKVGLDQFNQMLDHLESGKWKPKTRISLSSIETYEIDNSFRPNLRVKSKKTGLDIGFSYPKFGDVVVMKKFLKQRFEKEEKQFAAIKRMIEFRNEMEEKLQAGEDVNLSKIPVAPEAEVKKFQRFEIERALLAVDLIKAIQLDYFNGKDYTNASIEERLKVSNDPRIDYTLNKKVEDYFNSLKFGINEEAIPMYNPITEKIENRRFSFRFVDILQAIRSFDSDEYDIIDDYTH